MLKIIFIIITVNDFYCLRVCLLFVIVVFVCGGVFFLGLLRLL